MRLIHLVMEEKNGHTSLGPFGLDSKKKHLYISPVLLALSYVMIFCVLTQALVHIVLAAVVFATVVCPVLLILG